MFQCLSRRSRRRAGTPITSRLRRPLRLEPLEQRLAPAAAHVAVIGDYGTAGTPERAVDATDSHEPDGYATTSKQGQWLQAQLPASTAPWKVVYSPHPPYSSGYFGNTPVMQWPFQQWGATAVLSGSDHDYERIVLNGFP